MIRAENLTKTFGRIKAVDSIDFHIEKGEIIGFLGPNGAGKSTTMNMITGYLAPTAGSIRVDGLDIIESPEEAKSRIGYLPEEPPLYLDLTVNEYLDFVASFKKVPRPRRRDDLEAICDIVQISHVRKRLIKNLSKGYRQRVGLAQALVGNPPLLILDEPTVGLDPKQIIEIRELIRDLGKEHTVVLSSHILPEIAATCGRVLIIHQGVIVASDTPENLSRRLAGTSRLHVLVRGGEKETESTFRGVSKLENLAVHTGGEESTTEAILEAEGDADIREEVFRAAAKADLPILNMRPMDMTLEDIFLNLTTSEETD